MSIKNWFKKLFKSMAKGAVKEVVTPVITDTPTTSTPNTASADAVDYSTITLFGSCRPVGATIQDGLQIGNLKISGLDMSYSFVKGGCELLGATGGHDADHTQCFLGIKVGNNWKAAKFDWISTDRVTRGLEHCDTGYNDWPIDQFRAASEFCFFIVGVHAGKNAPTGKRSNVIYFKKG